MKTDLDNEFYFSTAIACEGKNLIFYKAINQKGKFVWINKDHFPESGEQSFYLTIISDLKSCLSAGNLIANSFNLFKNRQDFYSRYTFVSKVKKINEMLEL